MTTHHPQFANDQFRKATRSGDGVNWPNCVDVARRGGHVEVRDSKRKDTATYASTGLQVTSQEFDHFQNVVRTANLRTAHIPHDLFNDCSITITRLGENVNVLHRTGTTVNQVTGTELIYTDGEIDAFLDGVHAHEFDADSVTVTDTTGDATNQARTAVSDIARVMQPA